MLPVFLSGPPLHFHYVVSSDGGELFVRSHSETVRFQISPDDDPYEIAARWAEGRDAPPNFNDSDVDCSKH